MPTDSFATEELPPYLLPTATDAESLGAAEVQILWSIFQKISENWASETNPEHQRSQWTEFLVARTTYEPSYLAEYRNGLAVLIELQRTLGDDVWNYLFFREDLKRRQSPPTTRLDHFQTYVIDEFIRVWLTTGGFKAFGARNYNGYVSGSRFAVTPSYTHISKMSAGPT